MDAESAKEEGLDEVVLAEYETVCDDEKEREVLAGLDDGFTDVRSVHDLREQLKAT
jgi:hypothetical protein